MRSAEPSIGRIRGKLAFAMWLLVYPLVTALLLALQWTGWALALPVQTLLLSAILVPTIVFIVAPFVSHLTRSGGTIPSTLPPGRCSGKGTDHD